MEYLPEEQIYNLEVPLKQGYYNYLYGVDRGEDLEIMPLEGSSYKTENEYHYLVYFRKRFGEYDRIICYRKQDFNKI